MARIGLVGCGKLKADMAMPAGDLYTGALFRKSRAYAEATCDRWYVLSVFHGVIDPAKVIAPYDRRMGKTRSAQEFWGDRAWRQLEQLTAMGDTLVFLAGMDYAGAIRWWNRKQQPWTARTIEQPLAGLGIGQRLQWLTVNTPPR